MSLKDLDCVIIGYNEPDFRSVLRETEAMQSMSGAYRNLVNNTVLWEGERLTYMELLSWMFRESGMPGQPLHVAQLPNLGVCYLQSFLHKRGFMTERINFFNDEKESLREWLPRTRSVAITTTFYVDAAPILEVVKAIRRADPGVPIIVGGPRIMDISRTDSLSQDYILQQIGADVYVCDSQGENTLAQLLGCLRDGGELERVPNLLLPPGRKRKMLPVVQPGASMLFQATERQPESNSLDENSIDWTIFARDYIAPTAQMRTARSCAYRCSFCKYPVIAGALSLMSVEQVEAEMELLHNAGVRNLVIVDDTFNIPAPRFKAILRRMIARQFRFRWFSFLRCAEADEEGFDLMQASGCQGVFLGIEAVDAGVLRNMNKHADAVRYAEGIRRLNEREILSFASLIVGFPGETAETVESTIRFLEETRPSFYRAEIYYHSHNVPIHGRAAEFGLQGGGYSWKHNTMDWRTACDMVERIYTQVQGPSIFPLYGFDFWCIPYLLGKGLSVDQIRQFVAMAQPHLLASNRMGGSVSETEAALRLQLRELGDQVRRAAGIEAIAC